jgi:hypothetical protein
VAIAVRICSAKNKAGQPCKAAPLRDKDVCLAHDQEARESGVFGGAQPGAGHPRRRRWHELVNEEIERDAEKYLRPYRAAIESDDPEAGMKAVERLLDRLDGKPTQRTEQQHSGSFDVAAFFGVDPLTPTDSLPEEAGA